MSVRQVLAILWARRLTVVLVLLLAIVAAGLLATLLPRRYDATAQIFVNMGESDPVANTQGRMDLIPMMVQRNYVHTQMEFIKTEGVARKVAESLNLKDSPSFRKDPERSSEPDHIGWIAVQLLSKLVVERVSDSDIISVTYRSSSPDEAASVSNAFVEAYRKMSIDLRTKPAKELYAWFEERLSPLQKRLAEAEARRSELRTQMSRTDDGLKAGASDEYSKLANELTAARLGVIQARIALDQAKAGALTPTDNDETRQLRRQVSEVELRISRQMAALGPNHEAIRSWQATRAALLQQLDKVSKKASSSAIADSEARLVAAERRFNEVNSALDENERATLSQSGNRSVLVALDSEVDTIKSQIDMMQQRAERLGLEASINRSPASALTLASVPSAPAFPKIPLVLGLGATAGFVIGLALAILREMFDRRVRCSEDITALTTMPLLVVLPTMSRKRSWTTSSVHRPKYQGQLSARPPPQLTRIGLRQF